MPDTTARAGGSFAPPLTAEKLAAYRELVPADGPVRDAMHGLIVMAETFAQTPASGRPGRPHPVGELVTKDGRKYVPQVVPLEDAEVKRIWDVVPWPHELDGLSNKEGTGLFDGLTDKPLRDAAFHMLWLARELALDREPLTTDRLGI